MPDTSTSTVPADVPLWVHDPKTGQWQRFTGPWKRSAAERFKREQGIVHSQEYEGRGEPPHVPRKRRGK